MAQTKTIQLLRSSQIYESLSAAKEALGAADFIALRKDGEMVLARYNHTTGEEPNQTTVVKSLIGVYHMNPDLPSGTTAGVTYIEDITSAAGTSAALQNEVDAIESALGFNNDGTKDNFTGAAVTDGVITASDSLISAIQKVANTIAGMDKSADAVNGQVVTTIVQANGSVTETKANVRDLQLGGYSKDTSETGAIGSTDTVNTALSKLENNIAANNTARTVASSDQSITVTNSTSGTNVIVNVDGTTIIKDGTSHTLKSGLKVIKVIPSGTAGTDEVVDATLATNVKEAYRLVYNGSTTSIGQQVNVYKESALDRVYMGHVDDNVNSSTGEVTSGTGDDAMCFVYQQADGTYTLVSVNVESFLQEAEFGDGLQVANHVVTVKTGDGLEYGSESSGNKSVKVKIDSTSETFLTVGANGVKLSGVQTAINNAIADLDVTDSAVAGQYVSAVSQTDGKITVTRTDVSGAALNNYVKGSTATPVAATDTINQAISKLENQIDGLSSGIEGLDTEVTSNDGTNVQVKVTEVDGKITAVNVTTDNTVNSNDVTTAINNKVAALDGSATATAASGNVYTVLTSVTETDGVISKSGEVTLAAVAKTGDAADVAVSADQTSGLAAGNVQDTLEALKKSVNGGLDSVSSGNRAIAVGTKTGKDQSVSLVLDTTTTGNITSDMLEITSNGLMVKNTWDCGVF